MLHEFLETYRSEILALAEQKSLKLAGALSSSDELRKSLPIFYEHLIGFLKAPTEGSSSKRIVTGAAGHGKELLRLHYTLSHVVHSYGAMCQSITEFAKMRDAHIQPDEFNHLNLCLDIAIASAVSEFQFRTVQASEAREVQHLGALVHELRNALSSATIAHDMIKQGLVGTGGSTARVLEDNLASMRNLIDRSLSEVRMRADPQLHIETFPLNALVDQILLTAQTEARSKQQTLTSNVGPSIVLETDRQLLLSAIANLVQNALKYSVIKGQISIGARVSNENVIIEVEDECGGIAPGVMSRLFQPFASGGIDQRGLGLGLTIVQRAVTLIQGEITVNNVPGRGCAFRIEVPTKLVPKPAQKVNSGEKSVQPS